ncbi:MAG TPA: EthD family reductase [Candidatus Binataceae bacterium]|nr:EthD family reductase [Candidatus Binataceae bacterium]
MLHIHYFITRKASLADAEFHRYWRENHAPIVTAIKQLRMYVQSHRIQLSGTNSPYDGEAEVLVDSLEALAALRTSREYREGALADERNFIDLTRVEWMVTNDHVIAGNPAEPGWVKGVWQLRRKPGMSLDEFRRYWIEVHGALGLKLPGLRRYVQSHLIDDAYIYAEPGHDGVAQLWFDSIEALHAAFDSPAGKALSADGANFIEPSALRYFVAQEHLVIPAH